MLWYTLLALNIAPMREWALEFGGKEPEIHPYDTWVMIILLIIWIGVPEHKVRYSLRMLEKEKMIEPSPVGATLTEKHPQFKEELKAFLKDIGETALSLHDELCT